MKDWKGEGRNERSGMKYKIKPYCRWCKDEMCVNNECPARGDCCPVPDIAGVCMHEERHEMTLKEAWHNICVRLTAYANEHGFSEEDVTSEVMVESVICVAEDRNEKSDD